MDLSEGLAQEIAEVRRAGYRPLSDAEYLGMIGQTDRWSAELADWRNRHDEADVIDEPCNMGLRWRDPFCPDGHKIMWD